MSRLTTNSPLGWCGPRLETDDLTKTNKVRRRTEDLVNIFSENMTRSENPVDNKKFDHAQHMRGQNFQTNRFNFIFNFRKIQKYFRSSSSSIATNPLPCSHSATTLTAHK